MLWWYGQRTALKAAAAGLTDSAGIKVMVALAVWVVSTVLVAVTVVVCCEVTDDGAVYRPLLETVPMYRAALLPGPIRITW